MKKKNRMLLSLLLSLTIMGCSEKTPYPAEPNEKVTETKEIKEESVLKENEKNQNTITESVTEEPLAESIEEVSNTIDMTIDEYLDYFFNKHVFSPTSANYDIEYRQFIFGVQTPNDSEHKCSNAFAVQYDQGAYKLVDMRNAYYYNEDVVDGVRVPIISEEEPSIWWFIPPRFCAIKDTLLDTSAVWDITFEYDASVDATIMKTSNGDVVAYFGAFEDTPDFYTFTTHLTDGDFVVYLCKSYDEREYPLYVQGYNEQGGQDVSLNKDINFVTHH